MNTDQLRATQKDQISTQAKTLTAKDIQFLVETLCEKDDVLRYHAFLLLQAHSKEQPSVYAYWDTLTGKLDSDNSYQRSLGVMLIAENVRWDSEGKFRQVFDKFVACCNDEKFITARQTIQALGTIIKSTEGYSDTIKQALSKLDYSQYKENQQRLLKKDVEAVLKIKK